MLNTLQAVLTAQNTPTAIPLGNGQFKFTLASAANTSAGVYNQDDQLIRTLWSGVRYEAGSHVAQWDGLLDDDSTQAPFASYTIKVVSNNVTYTHEGGIGSTSNGSINGFSQITGFCFVGNKAFYGDSFAEGGIQIHYLNLDNINIGYNIDIGLSAIIRGVCTDGEKVYFAALDDYRSPANNFITAILASDNSAYTFAEGTALSTGRGGTTPVPMCALFSDGNTNGYTGIDVQKTGDYIFATRVSLNQLVVVNKHTGAVIKTLSTNAGTNLAITADDQKLWLQESTGLNQYSINSDGTITATGLTLPTGNIGFSISLASGELAIADAATCQIKFYNGYTGVLNSTLGRLNGYSGSPAVDNTKFLFLDDKTGANSPVINYQPDGSFWVRDAGTYRWVHYNADKSFKQYFMYIPSSRACAADPNVPSRVFADELEFYRDYTKLLDNGINGSWKLVNCWKPNTVTDLYDKFRNIVTLANGHTYALATNGNLYDLTVNGAIYITNTGDNHALEADGSLWNRTFPNEQAVITKQMLTGFDSDNVPLWGSPLTVITTSVVTPTAPFYYFNNTFGASTNTKRFFFFNPNHHNRDIGDHNTDYGVGYHFGGIDFGDTEFNFQTSKSTFFDYHGDYPRNGDFDIGNNDYNTQHSENCRVMVNGSDVFWHVNAEFWQANSGSSGVNIWNHYNENGLLVGNFGATSLEANTKGRPEWLAGNSFSTALVQVGDNYYLYYCDESAKGYTHSVVVSNLASIAVQEVKLQLSYIVSIPADNTDLMVGLPYLSRDFSGGDGWNILQPVGGTLSTSVYQYLKDKIDLNIESSGTQTVQRTLNNSNNLDSWSFYCELSHGAYSQPDIGISDNYNHLEILDVSKKVIARFRDFADISKAYFHTSYINDLVVKSGSPYDGTYSFNQRDYKKILINYRDGSFSFTYDTYTVDLINTCADITANMAAPGYLQIDQRGGQDHNSNISEAHFVPGASLGTATINNNITVYYFKFESLDRFAYTQGSPEIVVRDNENKVHFSGANQKQEIQFGIDGNYLTNDVLRFTFYDFEAVDATNLNLIVALAGGYTGINPVSNIVNGNAIVEFTANANGTIYFYLGMNQGQTGDVFFSSLLIEKLG